MKHIYLLLLVFMGLFRVQAQETVLAAGGQATASSGSVSYSIGQPFYEVNTSPNFSITAGVQQAVILCTTPTITATTPASVCGSGNVTISATPSAGTIQWFAAATGGTALTTDFIYTISGNSITLNNLAATTTLYAEAVDGSCISASRTAVTATVNNTAAPMANAQTFCNGATVANLVATGTALKWYDSVGSLLTSTTILSSGNYFVTQTVNGCESAQTPVMVTINSSITYYADADSDGFGNPAISIESCSGAPMGYVLLSTDCNDNNSAIYPNAIDVCYDGIDNDCNGNIDNIGLPGGCTPIYSLPTAGVPNSTVNYGGAVYTTYVAVAQAYRYMVTRVNPADDTPMSVPVTVDMGMRNLFLSNLSNYAYGAKFKVETTVRINNVWQPNYTPAFYVFTPTPLSTISLCGTQITNTTTQILSSSVALVSAYRYQVQRLDASNNVLSTQVITNGLRYFTFDQVTDLRYDANYLVSCSIRNTDGVFMAYGPSCTIQAPKYPTSEIRTNQCNNYAVSNYKENIYANLVRNVITFRFRLYNVSQGFDYSVDKNTYYFRLSDFPGLVPGETYSVQVAVKIQGQPDFGPFGNTCTIIVPNAARTIEDTQATGTISFEALVYPNPFAENFYFKVNSASNEEYTIQVYDMLGKLVETKTVAADSVESTEIGANFPAGVYNVILTQGANIKTLRVVKR